MATKYKETFNEMVTKYEKEFDAFQELHDKYEADPKKWQEEFNKEGGKIIEINTKFCSCFFFDIWERR